MERSEGDKEVVLSDGSDGQSHEPAPTSPVAAARNVVALHRRGPRSLVNLSLYAFGLQQLLQVLGNLLDDLPLISLGLF